MGQKGVINYFNKWKKDFKGNSFYIFLSLLFFIFVGIMNYFAGNFADRVGGVKIPDIILDNIPVFNISHLYVWGIFLTIGLLLFYPFIFRIKDFAYTFSQFSLLVLIRNFFIILNHFSSPEGAINIVFPWPISAWAFNNDLFFSGHVGIPLLGFFIFKDSKMRWVFLISAIFMGATTLLAHRHYGVDVFAALFIAYGSYSLGKFIFRKKSKF
jgi:membrane-associated phospholipid phosphatase